MDEAKYLLQGLWVLITGAAIFGGVNLGLTLLRQYGKKIRLLKLCGWAILAVSFEIATAEMRSFDLSNDNRSLFYIIMGLIGRSVECAGLWTVNYYMSGDRNGKQEEPCDESLQ